MASSMNDSNETTPPVTLASPFSWLARGWMDMQRNPGPGLLHGLLLSLFGALLYWFARDEFWLLAGAFSGLLIVAPVLATGMYAVSRAGEQGRYIGMGEIIALWRGRDPRLVRFGLLLGLAGTGWVLTSAGLITLLSTVPVSKPIDFLRHVVLGESSLLFEIWLLLGAVLAAPVFASSVLTIPLLVDTDYPLWQAVRLSWRAVADHPAPLALWASLIVLLVLVGLLSQLLGLVLVVPLLGHASWHAYRDLTTSRPQPLGAVRGG
ncbi:MAG: hypothetical protein RJA36_2564 [Pseudomonadota bacterium]|jgi:uncharacterized membrane protein